MPWIKSDYTFGNRSAVFYVPHKHFLRTAPFDLLEAAGDIEGLENAASELITRYRPELAGCVLYHMGFDHIRGAWEFAVSHASLSHVPMGDMLPRRPLDPAYEADVIATEKLNA